MIRFLLKRLALTIPTFFALMFITFVMIRLVPGDPIEVRRGAAQVVDEGTRGVVPCLFVRGTQNR